MALGSLASRLARRVAAKQTPLASGTLQLLLLLGLVVGLLVVVVGPLSTEQMGSLL
jgi:hypothetical protein